jgi:aspartyl protease
MVSHRNQTVLRVLLFLGLFCAPGVSRAAKVPRGIPGRIVAGYLLVVPVSINGRGPWDFVVDTGTNQTLVGSDLQAELRLPQGEGVTLNTLAGPQDALLAKAELLAVGSWSVDKLEILVGDVGTLRGLDGSVRGVLGMDFLYHFAFSLDYDPAQLRLFPADLTADPANATATRVNVRLAGGRLLVPSNWRDRDLPERDLALDSGIASVLLFTDGKNSAAGSGSHRWKLTTNSAATEAIGVSVPEFAIGDHRLRGLQGVLLTRKGEANELAEDGLLPTSLFRSVFVNATARIATFTGK